MGTFFARWWPRTRPPRKQRQKSRKGQGAICRRLLSVEQLECRQLLSGVTAGGAASVAASSAADTFTANAFDVVLKAQPDEWYAGYVGGPTVPYNAANPTPPSSQAIPRVNQDYLWGMTKSGNNLWLGTAANITSEAAATGLPGLHFANDLLVVEGGASKYPGISNLLRPILGDWRPPTIFRYDYQTGAYQDMVQTTALKHDPLLNQTLGLRSAGSTDDIVILGGPNLTTTGINLFAFSAKPDANGNYQYLGSKAMLQYNDIRQWATVTRPGSVPGTTQQQLYTAVGKTFSATGAGAVLRWTGTLAKPFSFEQVVALDGEGANLVEHAGRLFVDTWPLPALSLGSLLGRSSASVGIWMSPVLPNAGLTGRDAGGWQKVWTIDNYEPDPAIAKSYALGAMASFDGYLYWGSMQLVEAGMSAFRKQYPTASIIDALGKTTRATALFRGFQDVNNTVDTNTQDVQLLYGDNTLWKYTPPAENAAARSGTWAKVPNKLGPHLFGDAGFGNPANIYSWSMAVYNGQLYVGTYDLNTGLCVPTYVPDRGDLDVLETQAAALGIPNMRMGADLWRLPPSNGTPQPVTLEGAGNPLNVGIRTMAVTPVGLFLGTANISNLLTTPYAPPSQPLKTGGWELIQMNSISGQSLPALQAHEEIADLDPGHGDLWYRVQVSAQGHLVVHAASEDGGTAQLALFDDAHNQGALAIATIVHAGGTLDQPVGAGTYYLRVRGTSHAVDLEIAGNASTSPMIAPQPTSQPAAKIAGVVTQVVAAVSKAQTRTIRPNGLLAMMLQQAAAKRAGSADPQNGLLARYDPAGILVQLQGLKQQRS